MDSCVIFWIIQCVCVNMGSRVTWYIADVTWWSQRSKVFKMITKGTTDSNNRLTTDFSREQLHWTTFSSRIETVRIKSNVTKWDATIREKNQQAYKLFDLISYDFIVSFLCRWICTWFKEEHIDIQRTLHFVIFIGQNNADAGKKKKKKEKMRLIIMNNYSYGD